MKLSKTVAPVPNDDYAEYRNSNITVICSTDDTNPINISNIITDTPTTLIYCETVVINKPIELTGRNLGIFCQRAFILNTSEPDVPITVSVSGKNESGTRQQDVTEGNGKPGANGGSGGRLWFFVGEGLSQSDMDKLRLKANGGDGGPGGKTLDPQAQGGEGGKGGDAGQISIMFGSAAMNAHSRLARIKKAVWSEGSLVAESGSTSEPSLTSDLTGVQGFPEAVMKSYEAVISVYNIYTKAVVALQTGLNVLLIPPTSFEQPTPSARFKTLAKEKLGEIDKLLTSVAAPQNLPGDSSDITSLAERITSWSQGESDEDEDELIESLKAVEFPSLVEKSALMAAYDDVAKHLDILVEEMLRNAEFEVCSATGGVGGVGGPGGAKGPGERGKSGNAGQVKPTNLVFDGSEGDRDVDQAYTFPTQCRMLVSKADTYFFSNDRESLAMAYGLYSRLARRLAFVPKLVAEPQTGEHSPLYNAYFDLEYAYKASIAMFNELVSVYGTTMNRLNQLSLGMDMFGHLPNWAPRLSLNYYANSVKNSIPILEKVEANIEKYTESWKDGEKLREQVRIGVSECSESIRQATSRIELLNGPNGLLPTASDQVAAFTPQLKTKRHEVIGLLAPVEKALRNAISIDPRNVVESLTMLAFAPTKPMTLLQVADLSYKSWTELTNVHGAAVNKSLIVSELSESGKTLESLELAYRTRADDTIAIDDPSATKALGLRQDIESILKEFKNKIPDKDGEPLKEALDDFVGLIIERNNAVIQYNAALQLLHEAAIDQEYYTKQRDQLGAKLNELDPNLPSILLWLNKTRDDIRLDILQRLNYQARALRFWGLSEQVFSFTKPGPLRGSVELMKDQQDLDKAFELCLNSYSSSLWSFFPSQSSPEAPGRFYKLPSNYVATLKRPVVNGKETTYGVIFPFPLSAQELGAMCNIRLHQYRIWILKAKVNPDFWKREPVKVHVQQMGAETILNPKATKFDFTHDPVEFLFEYDSKGVEEVDDCVTTRCMNSESIENDYNGGSAGPSVYAPIGPFASWRIQLKATENPGLDLSKVEQVFVECCGRGMSLHPSLLKRNIDCQGMDD